jgi:hypothetical protein
MASSGCRARAAVLVVLAALLAAPWSGALAQEGGTPEFSGLDEVVNEALAEEAGRPARDPFIDTEAWGELWNLLLLGAGAVCGFVVGRYWNQIWGRDARSGDDKDGT